MSDLQRALSALAPEGPAPIDQAIAGGARAGSVGGAFLAGYQAALRALVPDLGPGQAALCATEAGGNHPRAIATRLEPAAPGWRLSGRKTFVTGGTAATWLLVIASSGTDEQGRNRLRLVRVRADAPGVRLEPLPPTPFTPEVPHAAVELTAVAVDDGALLPGDGWDRYLKPFRSVEDVHVHGALLAWLLGLGLQSDWERPLLEEACALLAATRDLSRRDPSDPATHLALGGLLGLGRAWIERTQAGWSRLGPEAREALSRDLALLGVAEGARARRAEAAWRALDARG